MKINYALLITMLLFVSCNNEGREETKATADSIDSQEATAMKDTVTNTIVESELNDLKTFPRDSVRVSYRGIVDTLYGYNKNGNLVFEGDIVLDVPAAGIKGVATGFRLWNKNNSGIINIPYVINAGYAFPEKIRTAMRMWQDKLDNRIVFIPMTFQQDFVEFIGSADTQSKIGKAGKQQFIELGSRVKEGNIAHEIGHCLGLFHEQGRKDRGEFVTISCDDDINYSQALSVNPFAQDIGPYDYSSIMHYPVDKCLKVKNHSLPEGIPGQRIFISDGDRATIKAIYKLN